MTGAEFLVKALEREGVAVVFGYPGGAILPVYDAMRDSAIQHILVRHEQAAAFAADGYARATGKVGVCMATSGPGATNLITGIANAFMDSIPLVAITGQVSTELMGTDAFQEVDVFGLTLPVVKHSFVVKRSEDLPRVLSEAFHVARSGRPGPVLIDIPRDVSAGEGNFSFVTEGRSDGAPEISAGRIAQAAALLRKSKRPIIYAGGGVFLGKAVSEFRAFAETAGIPVVATLKGLGALPTDHELFLGMLGMHGLKGANHSVQGCDLLICIGARFDDRATGRLASFAPGAKVIHMDVDPAEVGKLRQPDVALIGDIRSALTALAAPLSVTSWQQECLARKEKHAWDYDSPGEGIHAPAFLKKLSQAAGPRTVMACDVGQHQMWVAQHCDFEGAEHHLSSGGLGAMGFGLPAAIGAQIGCPNARVINVTGDGSVMMNLQELATVRRYDLPIKIVLFDNRRLGLVRQLQELFFDRRYAETDLNDNPDFVGVFESFGIPSFRLEPGDDLDAGIERLPAQDGPAMVQVCIEQEANVWPMVAPGKSNSEMMEGVPQ